MSTLNDTDLFVVEREGVQYKVEAVDVVVDPITGEFETPVEVLTPLNGAGIGSGVPYNPISSPIVTVGDGGSVTYETSAITSKSGATYTFTDDTNFDKFQVGDEVGDPGGIVPATYTGTNNFQTITTGISPDLVWIKNRTDAQNHCLYDTVRGVAYNQLNSDRTAREASLDGESGGLSGVTSDGFTLNGDNNVSGGTNASGGSFIAWCWDAGNGSPVTNNDGSIQSTVKASDKTGFSIVSYTGTGAAQTTGHGLNATPGFVIIKNRDTAGTNWQVFGDGYERLQLSTDGAELTDGYTLARTSTTISPTGNSVTNNQINANGDDYIAYCWTETPGVSKFGSYTGTYSTDKEINVGFQPALVITKRTDGTGDWAMVWQNNIYQFANKNQPLMDGQDYRTVLTDTGFIVKGAENNNSGGQLDRKAHV